MGQAIISGSVYPINSSVGEAIKCFTPPKIDHIQWELLSDRQAYLLSEYCHQSQIIAHWLVYLRTGSVNIKQFPFISAEFEDLRPKAELLNALLELCIAVWEGSPKNITQNYPTPAHWWRDCILEEQQAFINRVLQDEEALTKGDVEDGLRKFRRSLNDEKIPSELSRNSHLYKLYETALRLKTKTSGNEIKEAWKAYLKAMLNYTNSLKTNKEIKSLAKLGKNLGYREKHKIIPIKAQRVEKEAILSKYISYRR
jgi:ribosomal protein S21